MHYEPDKRKQDSLWQPELAAKLLCLLIALAMISYLGHVPGL